MNEIEQKIRALKVRKAMLFSNIEMLSQVNDSAYLQFGKLEADIMKLEKDLVRLTENNLQ
ncbi:hypothetical protein [Flavobacterium sp.]|uniref:hypothetical protein n=1 Tax=Flavobacterium sp. TaxID=239 RepID=UPI002C9BF7D3|nr:hypothetical protein [Flavobacterium sp.]HSD07898.1 hypothetical protein [Flavobacterium sp.]